MNKIADSVASKIALTLIGIVIYLTITSYLGIHYLKNPELYPYLKFMVIGSSVKAVYYPLTLFLFLAYFAFRYFKRHAFPKKVKITLSKEKRFLYLLLLKNVSYSVSIIVPIIYFALFSIYVMDFANLYYVNYINSYNMILTFKEVLKSSEIQFMIHNTIMTALLLIIAYAIHFVLRATVYHRKVAIINSDINKFIHANTELDKQSDIRDDLSKINVLAKKLQSKKYDPKKYFNLKKGIYLALSMEDSKPIYLDIESFHKMNLPHLSVSGVTGSGKGAATQVLLWQTAMLKCCNIVFVPQRDEYLMKSMSMSAIANGVNMHIIDFTNYDIPQFDLLQRCTRYEFDTLTSYMFPFLENRGSDGNYYAQFSRRVRKLFSKEAANATCMQNLIDIVYEKYGENALYGDDGSMPQFVTEFTEIAELPICRTANGINLSKAIENGDMIYVVCPDFSNEDYLVGLCKALFNRILQIIKARDEGTGRRVFWFIDEFSEFVNKPMKMAIEQIRKKGCNFIFNMTSFDSLIGINKDVNTRTFMNTVITNSIKLIYAQPHPESAASMSDLTFKKVVNKTSMSATVGDASSANFSDNVRRLNSDKENLISEGIIANLPPYACVYMRTGEISKVAYTGVLNIPSDINMPVMSGYDLYEIKNEIPESIASNKSDIKPSKKSNDANSDHKARMKSEDNTTPQSELPETANIRDNEVLLDGIKKMQSKTKEMKESKDTVKTKTSIPKRNSQREVIEE